MTMARRKPDRKCDVCGEVIMRCNSYGVCTRNDLCRRERDRRDYAQNAPKKRQNAKISYAANRAKISERRRHHYTQHRKQIRKAQHADYQQRAPSLRVERALRGIRPKSECRGHLASGWFGGRIMPCAVLGCHRMAGWRAPYRIKQSKIGFYCSLHRRGIIGRYEYCSVPGCGRSVGWRTPYEIKNYKTGFRCSVHRHIGRLQLAELQEKSNEDERKEVRSSVA